MISPDLAFLLIAGLAFLGFVLDALFDRTRVTSVLPLMLLGIAFLYFHILPGATLRSLAALVPYVSALTVAFILFHVGLGIRFEELSRVLGRALGFTLSVQIATGIALSLLAWYTFHWSLLISFIFGFGLSGPSSISVPVLVRVARMPESLRTSLLFESVVTDLLQLLVPLFLVGLLVSGELSTVRVSGQLALTLVGSAAAGIAAAILWLWILDRIGPIAREYSWTLTITMVLATYGLADYLGMSAAITIFVFGLMIGNRKHLEFDPLARRADEWTTSRQTIGGLRRVLRLTSEAVDVEHIQQVQKEVSFFASAFFFVYIGLLFQTGTLTVRLLLVPLVATVGMLVIRLAGTPLLAQYFSVQARARRSQRALVAFNIPRGLAAAIVATVPLSRGVVIPGFLDAMFLGILYSTLFSTIGIFLYYDPDVRPEVPTDPASTLPGDPLPVAAGAVHLPVAAERNVQEPPPALPRPRR